MQIAAICGRPVGVAKEHWIARSIRCSRIAVSAKVRVIVEQGGIGSQDLPAWEIAVAGHAESMPKFVRDDSHEIAFVRRHCCTPQLWLRIEPIVVLNK